MINSGVYRMNIVEQRSESIDVHYTQSAASLRQ